MNYAGLELSSLSWLLPELEKTLGAVRSKAASAVGAGAAADYKEAAKWVHEAVGAFQVLDAQGLIQYLELMESVLLGAAKQQTPSPAVSSAIDSACVALFHYLQEMNRTGHALQPLVLFNHYQALAQLSAGQLDDSVPLDTEEAGVTVAKKPIKQVHPMDLFYPPLGVRLNRHRLREDSEQAADISRIRQVFEADLLKLLSGVPTEADVSRLSKPIRALAVASHQAQQYSFWKACEAAILQFNRLDAEQAAWMRRWLARLNLQIRRVTQGGVHVSERLFREALFYVATQKPSSPLTLELMSVYRLIGTVPKDLHAARYLTLTLGDQNRCQLLIQQLKAAWEEATPAVIDVEGGKIPLAVLLQRLSQAGGLLAQLNSVFVQSRHEAAQVALAPLLQQVNQCVTSKKLLTLNDAGAGAQVILWLEQIIKTQGISRDQLMSQARQHQAVLMGQVASSQANAFEPTSDLVLPSEQIALLREVRTLLADVEKILDQFFRVPSFNQPLLKAASPLRQSAVALELMLLPEAVSATQSIASQIDRFVSFPVSATPAAFESLAQSFGLLSLQLEVFDADPSIARQAFKFDTQTQRLTDLRQARGVLITSQDPDDDVESLESLAAKQMVRTGDLLKAFKANPGETQHLPEMAASLKALKESADLTANSGLSAQAEDGLEFLATVLPMADDEPVAQQDSRVTLNQDRLNSLIDGLQLPLNAKPLNELAIESAAKNQASNSTVQDDDDIVLVFIEEAEEVLDNIHKQLPPLTQQPRDLERLSTVRRYFHTLKGSARTVGMRVFGDYSARIETVLNQQIAEQAPVSKDVLALIRASSQQISAWIVDAKAGKPNKNAGDLSLAIDLLKPHLLAIERATAFNALANSFVDTSPLALAALDQQFAEQDLRVTEIQTPSISFQQSKLVGPHEAFELAEPIANKSPITPLTAPPTAPLVALKPPAAAEISQLDAPRTSALSAVLPPVKASISSTAPQDKTSPISMPERVTSSPDDKAELTGFEVLTVNPGLDLPAVTPPIAAANRPKISLVANNVGKRPEDFILRARAAVQADRDSQLAELQTEHDTASSQTLVQAQIVGNQGEAPSAVPAKIVSPRQDFDNTRPAALQQPIDQRVNIGPLKLPRPLFEIYLSESKQHVTWLLEATQHWPLLASPLVSEGLYRHTHSIRGEAATIGLGTIRDIASSLEDLLLHCQQRLTPLSEPRQSLIRQTVLRIARMYEAFSALQYPEGDMALVQQLGLAINDPSVGSVAVVSPVASSISISIDSTNAPPVLTHVVASTGAPLAAGLPPVPQALKMPLIFSPMAPQEAPQEAPEADRQAEQQQQPPATAHLDLNMIKIGDAPVAAMPLIEFVDPVSAEFAPTEPAPIDRAPVQETVAPAVHAQPKPAALKSVETTLSETIKAPEPVRDLVAITPATQLIESLKQLATEGLSAPSAPVFTRNIQSLGATSPLSGLAGAPARIPVELRVEPSVRVQPPVSIRPATLQLTPDQTSLPDETSVVADELDADLLADFTAEAEELLPQAFRVLSAARDSAFDLSEFKRHLHTLKGASRMAGALRMGRMLHDLESTLERNESIEAPYFSPDTQHMLESALDDIALVFAQLKNPSLKISAPSPSLVSESTQPTPSEKPPVTPADAYGLPYAVNTPLNAPSAAFLTMMQQTNALLDEALSNVSAAAHPQAASSADNAVALDTLAAIVPSTSPSIAPIDRGIDSTITAQAAPTLDDANLVLSTSLETSDNAYTQTIASSPVNAPITPSALTISSTTFSTTSSKSISGLSAPAQPQTPATVLPALRMRTDVLDRLVNQATEMSTSRGRLSQHVLQLRQALKDMSANVARITGQLREIDIQAESQMSARTGNSGEAGFDPLEFDRFTRLQEITRMLSESLADMLEVRDSIAKTLIDAEKELADQTKVGKDLTRSLMRTRLVAFDVLSDRLYRTVRQAGKDQNKSVRLDIQGAHLSLDRSILERSINAIEHLLRNSVVHGIELATIRTIRNKPAQGLLSIHVKQMGNELELTVFDDGGGLDLVAIRTIAIQKGLIAADAELNDTQLAELIFVPGFSTATELSELAGRGIGMDVVRNDIAALGGRIVVQHEQGLGTRFVMRIPLTLSQSQIIVVKAAGALYGVPASLVDTVLSLKTEQLAQTYASGHVTHRGEHFSIIALSRLLGLGNAPISAERYSPVLLVSSGTNKVAVHVDTIERHADVVIKPLSSMMLRVPGLSSATLMSDGALCLVLDPAQLWAYFLSKHGSEQAMQVEAETSLIPTPTVDLSPVVTPEPEPALIAESVSDVESTLDSVLTPHTAPENLLDRDAASASRENTFIKDDRLGIALDIDISVSAGTSNAPLVPVASGSAVTPSFTSQLAKTKLVMVVDDSLTMRRVSQKLLTREGWQVLLAKDGLDALEQLQTSQPTVMLVDIEMPRMDGFDLTRNVRADPRLKATPIIMITSRIGDKHRDHAYSLGVNAYLGKPYRDDELMATIAKLTV